MPRHLFASRFAASAILVLSSGVFAATVCRAQDQQEPSVADAAKQARAKKQEAQKSAKHVYTEEDLKRSSILTPEDRAEIEAKRNECAQKNNCSPAPSQNAPASVEANSETPATSLGDVARKYRREKELRAQKQKELLEQKQKELQALKPKQSEPFHLPFSNPTLASPILPERPVIQLPAAPELRRENHSPMTRRDPFSRVRVNPNVRGPEPPRLETPRAEISQPKSLQPKILPTENLRPERIHPSFGRPVRPVVSSHRKVFARPAPPALFARPALSNHFALPLPEKILVKPAQPAAPVVEAVRPARPVQPVQPALVSPAAATTAPIATPAASTKTVSVRTGDSLWKLAQQNLGSGRLWPELLAANSWIADPNQIRAGARLVLPVAAAAPRAVRSNTDSSARIVKIRKGDTLWALAKANLGRFSAWHCLAAANPGVANPDRILEGQELRLPAACGVDGRSGLATSPASANPASVAPALATPANP